MRITVRYIERCPNWRLAEERVLAVLAETGREAQIAHELVASDEEARRLGFAGSPTVLVDGRDPFPCPPARGRACRLYLTEAGPEGAPSLAGLRAALAG